VFHKKRVWAVADCASPAELAELLTNQSWCSCCGFRLGGYLFLNDQTGPDGAGEWGVVMADDPPLQVESVTFGWTGRHQALDIIWTILKGRIGVQPWNSGITGAQIVSPIGHRCGHCA
jgi:hypothetical protein